MSRPIMKFKLIKIDDIIEFPKNTSKYLSKYLQYLFTMICLFSKRKKKCCMYWIAFSLLPLKLYAWPCKCILEIHSWLQRKMVYVICELTWFFQKQKITTIGTLLCKLVVYLSAVTKNTSKLLNNYSWLAIYTNQFRIMSDNIFCFWKKLC